MQISKYSPLLKHALERMQQNSNYYFKKGRLSGSTEVFPDERSRLAIGIASSFAVLDKYERSEKSTVFLSPPHICPTKTVEIFKKDKKPVSQRVDIEYGLVGKPKKLAWDSKYSIQSSPGAEHHENIHLSFVAVENDEAVGYFGFSITFSRSKDWACYSVKLDLVYVRPQYRNYGTHGLNLTVAVSNLTKDLFTEILKMYRGKTPLNIMICADFESKGGEKIALLVLSEFNLLVESCPDLYPHLTHKIGEVIDEMGY